MKLTMKFLALIFGLLMLSNAAYAETPREKLKQMVERLQQNPDDDALREKIIKLAQKLKPAPTIPEEARRSFVEGNTITRSAKNAEEQLLAVESFNEAIKNAPWWGDAYYNLAVAQELAGRLDDSETSLKLYLLTNPPEKESREAQDRIYSLSAKKKLALASIALSEKSPANLVQGSWHNKTNTHEIITIKKEASGHLTVSLNNTGVRMQPIRVDGIITDRTIRFTMDIPYTSSDPRTSAYELELSADGSSLTGWVTETQSETQWQMFRSKALANGMEEQGVNYVRSQMHFPYHNQAVFQRQ